MLLLALAIAPGLAICIYIFYRDAYNREPATNLLISFIFGILATIPAVIIELMTKRWQTPSVAGIIFYIFFFVALVEEGCKYLALRYYALKRKSFDEPLDGIVYSVMISMGFATLENIAYIVFEKTGNGLSVALLRMFTSVPGHATFAVIMGYYIGKAKFDPINRKSLMLKGILGATIAHGTYDSFLFLNQNNWIKHYLPNGVAPFLLFAGAIASLIIAIRLSKKLIRLHQLTSQQLFKSAPVLTLRHCSFTDIEMIRILAYEIWPQTYSTVISTQQINYMLQTMYSIAALQKQMEDNHHFIIVYNAGVPVGFASYGRVESSVYKLHKLYILPTQQGKGTGSFVIEQIITDIKANGATTLLLNVNRTNVAKNFYEKIGFEIIRSEDSDIGNGFFMNDYVMEKKLTPHPSAFRDV